MNQTSTPHPSRDRSRWVRLRTLVMLRWIAIVGQVGALIVADRVLDLRFAVDWCYVIIGLSIMANILASFLFPENKRLSEGQVAANLGFDIAMLMALVYFTGGMNNPFALLVLAPIAVSAAALRLKAIVSLVALTMVLVVLVAQFHQPLRTVEGFLIQMPAIVEFGFLIATLIGIVFVATLIRWVSDETHTMGDALMATQLALSREQKLTDIGGVVAAAAHELGTPLATIKLVSSELSDQLDEGSEPYEDALLIGEQADRCRDILRSMGRAGKDDRHLRNAPLEAIVEEAAEPHVNRGKSVIFSAAPELETASSQPIIRRAPEILHGLRNLVQNAVDFADTTVWVDIMWSDEMVQIKIADDGAGYPPNLIGRLGDPFMRRRSRKSEQRPEYEGMGLGLFIAKTLLERSGAELTFANGSDPFLRADERPTKKGALVEVQWARSEIAANEEDVFVALGDNQPLEI